MPSENRIGLAEQLAAFMKDETVGSAVFSGEDALGPDDSNQFFLELTTLVDKKKATKEIWDEGTKVRVAKTTQPVAIPKHPVTQPNEIKEEIADGE